MSGRSRSPGCSGKRFPMRSRRLGIEALDSRLMMSASPWFGLDAAGTETGHDMPSDFEVPVGDLAVDAVETPTLEPNAAFPGGGAYPNPEDDDGGWGPIGPWVHKALDKLAKVFAQQLTEELSVQLLSGGELDYPDPDDDGDWGPLGPVVKNSADLYLVVKQDVIREIVAQGTEPDPEPWDVGRLHRYIDEQLSDWYGNPEPQPWIHWGSVMQEVGFGNGGDVGYPAWHDDGDWGPLGPVVHEAFHRLAGSLAARLHDELPMMLMQGGGAQPAPGDDTDWPHPIDPLIRTADDLYSVAAQEVVRELVEDTSGPDPTPWTVDRLNEYLYEKLFLWFRGPDPTPWFNWVSLVREAIGTSGSDVGYPAWDDDVDWGPIGPLVHDTPLAAGDANGDLRFDQSDIVEVLQGGKYMTGEWATWRDGDFNRDGLFNQLDIITALKTGNYLAGPYAEQGNSVDLILAEFGR